MALYVALTVAARLTNRLNAYAVQLLQHRLRATLLTSVLHPGGGAVRAPDGDVVSVMTNDVARLANAGLLVVLPIARIAAIGFIAASLLVTHWPLGVVVLLGAPVAVWLMGLLSERLSRDTREYQDLLADTVGRATDLVAGYRVIKGVPPRPRRPGGTGRPAGRPSSAPGATLGCSGGFSWAPVR